MGKSSKKTKKRQKAPTQAEKARAGRLKKARLRSREQRDERLRQVAKLRFVQSWSNAEIAQKLGVTERTIERDSNLLRSRMRKSMSGSNLDNEMRDIAETLKLRHEETIKLLWNDYMKASNEGDAIKKEFEELRATEDRLIESGEKDVLIQSTDKEKLFLRLLEKCERLLAQITDTDSQFVEQLRKLGLVRGEFDVDPDDGSFLLEIRARKAKIDEIHKKSAAKPPVPPGGKS